MWYGYCGDLKFNYPKNPIEKIVQGVPEFFTNATLNSQKGKKKSANDRRANLIKHIKSKCSVLGAPTRHKVLIPVDESLIDPYS